LSRSGTAFREDVLQLMGALNAACDRARRVAKGEVGMLRIGYVEVAGWDGIVPDSFQAYRQATPGVRLELTPAGTPEQLARMADGALDGGFIYQFGALPRGLASISLQQHGVLLAMPAGWKDRPRGAIRLRDLGGAPFVFFHRSAYPAYHDHLLSACASGGLVPNIVQEAQNEAAMLSLVSAGIGIAIVNDRNRYRPPSRVEFAEIRDLRVRLPLSFVFHDERANPAIDPMLDYLRGAASKPRAARR
jgi:DNA-binding transcriptional LysR family regulator